MSGVSLVNINISSTDISFTSFGASTDIPVTGDWNGDGKTEIGSVRANSNGALTWFLDNGNGAWNSGTDTTYAAFGATTDTPVTGDWNGDGKTEIGTARKSGGAYTWFLDNGNGAWNSSADTTYAAFGATTDTPVTGDWNGDGKTEIGTARKSGGAYTWFLDNGNGAWNSSADTTYAAFGATTDTPVTGDWNGDGKTEIGTARKSGGAYMWFLDNGNGAWNSGADTTYTSFGASTDTPVTETGMGTEKQILEQPGSLWSIYLVLG